MNKVGILLLGYRRPELLLKRLLELKRFNFLSTYVSIDKYEGDDAQEIYQDFQEIKASFSNVSNIHWLFKSKKMGLTKHLFAAVDEVLNEKDAVVIVEDDIAISEDPFNSLIKLLENGLPKKILTAGLFGGLSFSSVKGFGFKNNFWRSTPYFSAWCWGIEREKWLAFRKVISVENSWETFEFKSDFWRRLPETKKRRWDYRFGKLRANPIFTWDYQLQYFSFKTNMNHYLPVFRAVDNVGFNDSRASNTRERRPNWYQGESLNMGIDRELSSKIGTQILVGLDSLTWAGDSPIPQKYRLLRYYFLSRIFRKKSDH